MIKKYIEFVKENKQTNEDLGEEIYNDIQDEETYQEAEEEFTEGEEEEEGGDYIGKKMISDLADTLDVQPEADGSIMYNGKKINFFSETEMFHVDRKKFQTVEDVINYLDNNIKGDEESYMMKNDEILRQRELEDEDDRALLAGEGDIDLDEEPKLESVSYRRRFEKSKK